MQVVVLSCCGIWAILLKAIDARAFKLLTFRKLSRDLCREEESFSVLFIGNLLEVELFIVNVEDADNVVAPGTPSGIADFPDFFIFAMNFLFESSFDAITSALSVG